MIGYLLHYKEEGMALIMENKISQMTTTSTPTGPYSFPENFHNQIA